MLSVLSARRGAMLTRLATSTSNIPLRPPRASEKTAAKRARLFYQCRKRGTLENGILLSSFADKHLEKMNKQQLVELDHLINDSDSDWKIYYWMTGREAAPPEFECEVLKLLQSHCQQQQHTHNQQPNITPSVIYH